MVNLLALRLLLRYLHLTGMVPNSLAGAVPPGRGRPRNAVVRAASRGGVRAVLDGCDRLGAAGRRDYAILLKLARLAIRAGEVARLHLADVNWRRLSWPFGASPDSWTCCPCRRTWARR